MSRSDAPATFWFEGLNVDEIVAKVAEHERAREKRKAEHRAAELKERGPAQVVKFPADRMVRVIRHGKVVKGRKAIA